MTRDRHLAIWGPGWEDVASQNFDRFAGEGNPVIDAARTQQDIDRLWNVGEPIARYVNEGIAHTQEVATASVPTYEDLNAAMDAIGELLEVRLSA